MNNRDDFTKKYSREESQVRKYKERLQYRKYAKWGLLASVFYMFPLSWVVNNLVPREYIDIALILSAFIIFFPFLVNRVSNYYLSHSPLTSEMVGYHELANAIREYEKGSFDESLNHLSECKPFLDHRGVRLLPTNTRDYLVDYVDSVESVKHPSREVERTFEDIYPIVIDGITDEENAEIESVIEGIKDESLTEVSAIERAKMDFQQLMQEFIFGFWGIVISAFSIGYFVFHFYSKTLGAGIIGAILTVYGLHQRRDN